MAGSPSRTDRAGEDGADPLVVAYRHDAHKLTGHDHATAPETFAGVPVNQPVPDGADADAAALSRPGGTPEQTVPAHGTHARLSVLTGAACVDPATLARDRHATLSDLLTPTDPAALHRAWLTSTVAGGINESVYYPYTSLKYHTLLVAALLDTYRADHGFADLRLVVDPADVILPHRTVYAGDRFALRITPDADGRPWARLGDRPYRSWASVWSQLTAHPLAVDSDRHDMILDANLRRIRAWSTALQYIEDYEREVSR